MTTSIVRRRLGKTILMGVLLISLDLSLGCDTRPQPGPGSQSTEPDPKSVSDFTTKVSANVPRRIGERNAGALQREFEIKYTGKAPLNKVEITLTLDYVSREHREEHFQFDTWDPGESKVLEVGGSAGRAVKYRWSGSATKSGELVRLAGESGSNE